MPTSRAATWAAFKVGVTTSIRRPCSARTALVAARVVVLPAPAAPSTTTSPAWPASAATAVRWSSSSPSAAAGGQHRRCRRDVGSGREPGHDVGLGPEHVPRGQRPDVLGDTRLVQQRHARLDRAGGEVLGQLDANGRRRRRARPRRSPSRPHRGCRRRSTPTVGRPAGPGWSPPRRRGRTHPPAVRRPPSAARAAVTGRGSPGRGAAGSSARPVSAPSVGTILSGRASFQARRSHDRRTAGPGSWPGFAARHSASYRSMLRPICAARSLNAPTKGASSATSPVAGSRVNPAAASAARNSGSHITAAWPMPLSASMESRNPTVCRPRHCRRRRTPGR